MSCDATEYPAPEAQFPLTRQLIFERTVRFSAYFFLTLQSSYIKTGATTPMKGIMPSARVLWHLNYRNVGKRTSDKVGGFFYARPRKAVTLRCLLSGNRPRRSASHPLLPPLCERLAVRQIGFPVLFLVRLFFERDVAVGILAGVGLFDKPEQPFEQI